VINAALQHLVCPITQKLFVDPVVLSDGYTYEREAVVLYLEEHNTSPVTGQLLRTFAVIPNRVVLELLQALHKTGSFQNAIARQEAREAEKKEAEHKNEEKEEEKEEEEESKDNKEDKEEKKEEKEEDDAIEEKKEEAEEDKDSGDEEEKKIDGEDKQEVSEDAQPIESKEESKD
tara:strand:- start:387 stop:911 length:525 start_codon:yes stop_codon:yes gene_type:complete